MATPGKRATTKSRRARQEAKVFAWIFLLVVVLCSTFTLLIAWSSLPDLYYTVPPSSPGARGVAWSILDHLLSLAGGPETARGDLFTGEVQVAGYMVAERGQRPLDGSVTSFLLVAEAGNWLHPPHLEDGIEVTLKNGTRTPLIERRGVVVRGALSVQQATFRSLTVAARKYHLLASDIRALEQ